MKNSIRANMAQGTVLLVFIIFQLFIYPNFEKEGSLPALATARNYITYARHGFTNDAEVLVSPRMTLESMRTLESMIKSIDNPTPTGFYVKHSRWEPVVIVNIMPRGATGYFKFESYDLKIKDQQIVKVQRVQ